MTTDPSGPVFTDPSLVADPPDPDLAPPGAGVEAEVDGAQHIDPTDLLALAEQELTSDLRKPPLVLEVAGRPGWSIEYDVNIDEPQLRVWETRATSGRRGQEKIDTLVFACILVANCAQRILRGELPLIGDDQRPLLFGHRRLQQMYGVDSARGAVRKLLGDPGADSHADAILAAAGYGERARAVDPTQQL